MTRETKIGMAIATTFLSLMGLVVASKMRPPEAAADSVVEVRPDHAKPGSEESSAPPIAVQPPGGGVRTAQGTEPAPVPATEVPAQKKEPAPKQSTQPKKIVPADGLPIVPATPAPLKLAPPGGPPALDVKTPFPGLPEASPNAVGGLPAIEPNPLVIDPLPKKKPNKLGAMPPPTDAVGGAAPLKVGQVTEPGSTGPPQPLPIPFKDPLPKDPLPKDPLADKANGLPGLPPVKESIGNPIQLPPVQPDPLKQKPEPMPIVPLPTPDPIKPKLDINVGNPAPTEKKNGEPVPPPLTSGGVTAPIAPAPKGASIGTIGNTGGEIRITSPVTPGGSGSGASVPLLPTASSNLPKVTSYDEKTHIAQAGETSFEELSKTLYGTPAYGSALLEYNRQHVLATANVKQNPPVVAPNQRVYYPDINVLEKQYRPLIQGLPAAAPAAPAPTVKISAPTPLAGPGVSGANPPTADATTAYRLAQPQFIYDIARQQLGDGLLWPEILRLNPALRTDQPIPAGTELRLPKAR